MPYPNYHAARIRQPGRFVRIRTFRVSREGIIFKGGPLKTDPDGKAVLQTIWFPRKKFTVAEAKKWLRDHKHKYILFEKATGKD